ncbi:thiol:disulfide interchange protein DsbC [Acinetobacter calcoaceticus]|uniref:Thiol:disulfide interchange protein n=1 Tax=Acinetobacter calcoaceticus TaxID=471 RepID=A0A4R1XX57_ACICA|nr:thiol:disulfide interchange protein DsbC [Acinetobacter calcoaceticus]
MFKPFCLALSLGLSSCFMATSFASVDTVKAKLAQQYPNVKIEDLKATEMQGLYSASLDNQIVYVNEQAQHLFVGSMIRIKDQHNLTKDLALAQPSIDVKKLPLQDAIKTVIGNGQRQLIVFSDPNCPYCKTLEANLAQLNNVTIYTFLYPLKAQSIIPSKQVWCSPNKAYAWQSLIRSGVKPTAAANCETPIERNLALGKALKLQGTPAVIFSNGHLVLGAYPADEINKLWQKMGL